jgi:hypothetical protein
LRHPASHLTARFAAVRLTTAALVAFVLALVIGCVYVNSGQVDYRVTPKCGGVYGPCPTLR